MYKIRSRILLEASTIFTKISMLQARIEALFFFKKKEGLANINLMFGLRFKEKKT